MAQRVLCPGDGLLQRLVLGLVPADEAAALERHFLTCTRCAARVTLLHPRDGLADVVRGQQLDGALPEPDVVLGGLLSRLRALPLSHPANDGAGGGDDTLAMLAPPGAPGELGRLGPYRVLRVLGSGGMGVVFAAHDARLRRAVALKVLRADRASERRRFLREARAAAALGGEHVVPVFEVGEDNGVPYLAMPLLRGETLEDRLGRDGRLPTREALRIGRQVALGLAAVHAHGLIHRDLKPANIWVEEGSGRVLLLDFGLAQALADAPPVSQAGLLVGTPHYMAPEQADGLALDARADLFSLGCVLYRMATGQLPFPGQTPLAVLRSLAVAEPLPPQALNPALPRPLAALIGRLLAKDPADRPASAQVVHDALAAVERYHSPSPGRRARVALAAAVALAAVTGAAALYAPRRQPPPPHREPPRVSAAAPSEAAPVPETNRPVRTFAGHRGTIWSLAVSPDGRRLASCSEGQLLPSGGWKPADASARLWDMGGGRQLGATWETRTRVHAVAFAPDARAVLASGIRFACTRWGEDRRQEVIGGEGRPYLAAAFSADRRRLVTSGSSDHVLRLWDVGGGKPVKTFEGHTECVHSLALSADGRYLASGGGGRFDSSNGLVLGRDFDARLWDVATGRELRRFRGHQGFVWGLAFTPDNRLLSACVDGQLRLWDLGQTEPVRVFAAHAGGVTALAASANGHWAVTGGADNLVRLWDLRTGQERHRFRGHTAAVRCVTFPPDGRHVLSGGGDGTILLWALPDGTSATE